METTYSDVVNPLKKWQSLPSMIPVVLELLRDYYNGSHSKKAYSASLSDKIQEYENMLTHWKNLDNLTPVQENWLRQIGSYIEALQKKHTIFTPNEKFSEDLKSKNEMENTQKIDKNTFSLSKY